MHQVVIGDDSKQNVINEEYVEKYFWGICQVIYIVIGLLKIAVAPELSHVKLYN